jgi:hypothetical protein
MSNQLSLQPLRRNITQIHHPILTKGCHTETPDARTISRGKPPTDQRAITSDRPAGDESDVEGAERPTNSANGEPDCRIRLTGVQSTTVMRTSGLLLLLM